MNAVGWLGSCLYRGVGTVSGPFHPFGGAVDIIVVEQPDGSFKSSPWYVRFGKFQGVLKNKKNAIKICVNDVEAGFNMYLDHTGQAYFLREGDDAEEGESLVYPLSSGDEADGRSCNYDDLRRPMKSQSCNYDVGSPSSSNGKMVGRPGILGYVFGRSSMKVKGDRFSEGEEFVGMGVERASSLERAEIAADLLEVKWSTNLNSRMTLQGNVLRFSDGGETDANKIGDVKDEANREQVQDNVEISVTEISFEQVVDSSSSGDELGQDRLEDKFLVSSKISRGLDEMPIRVNNNDSIWGTTSSREASPGLQLVEGQDYNKSNALSQCDKIHDEESGSNRVQPFVLCETTESLVFGSEGSNEKTSTTLYLASEGNGEIYVHAESINMKTTDLLPQDTATEYSVASGHEESSITLESVNHLVGIDSRSGSAEEVELGSIGTSHGGSSPVHQVQDENNNLMNDHHPIQSMADSQSTSATSIPHLESSEEEQFLFSDLDESKLIEFPSVEIAYLDTVNENKKEIREQYDTSNESSMEMSKIASNPIGMNNNHEFGGKEDGRLVESLPNMRFHELDAEYQQPLCHSLDSNSKSLNWSFRKEESTLGNSDVKKQHQLVQEQCEHRLTDEEQNSEDSSNSVAFRHVLANPEVGASSSGSWKLWPFSLKRSRTDGKTVSNMKDNVKNYEKENGSKPKMVKKTVKAVSPTSEQLALLNLKEGRNDVTFTFSTKMLGTQQVDARMYLWKWNTRVVISDVDGTITKSDVLGQFMPLVGIDWSQTGVTHLFSAIKENGYQLMFLSARAISQASVTRQFLINLKQDGKALPDGPVVISPDGLFPSLFREVIRRAPHEFKITCLEDIRALFPPDYNPFYAGFGNRDTDEISYLKVGIPRGKVFIINPRGEVAVNRRVGTRSYTSLHALVNGMFPARNTSEQEDYNDVNFWKLPPPVIDL